MIMYIQKNIIIILNALIPAAPTKCSLSCLFTQRQDLVPTVVGVLAVLLFETSFVTSFGIDSSTNNQNTFSHFPNNLKTNNFLDSGRGLKTIPNQCATIAYGMEKCFCAEISSLF